MPLPRVLEQAGLRGTSSWLEQQFDDAVRRAEASLG